MKLTRTQPGLMPSQPRTISRSKLREVVEIDAQQPVPVGPGARAAAARLDAEEVVEQRDDEVVVQVPRPWRRTMKETMESRSASGLPRMSMLGFSPPRVDGAADEALFALRGSRGDARPRSLSWKTSPARIDSRIAGVPPSSRCTMSRVAVLDRVDVSDRAAARHRGDAVLEQVPLGHEHARACPGRR